MNRTNQSKSVIEFRESLPAPNDYRELFETTGWNQKYNFSTEDLANALKNSWYTVSLYDEGKLIGFGRVIADGVHHALIVDLIVHPLYQGQGLGRGLLDKLVTRCKEYHIRDIQLFSAQDKYAFYEKSGFEKRAVNAPGMQLRY